MNCHDKGYTGSDGLYINRAAQIYAADNCKTCKGEGHTKGDEKLLAYLYKHKHMTPFEMAGMTIEVQAPIFVFREWHRHRTQSYNELSARYTPVPDLHYVPSLERLLMDGGTNKQAQGTGAKLTLEQAENFRKIVTSYYNTLNVEYNAFMRFGVPKELARILMPVGRYSRMRASANLRNWLAFLTLRMDEAAQWEIRQYANAVGAIIAEQFPRTWALFVEGRK
jgi:thymidylate synthase (FAD)